VYYISVYMKKTWKNGYEQVPFTMYIYVPSRIWPVSSTSPCRRRSPWVPMVGSSGGCPGVLNVFVQWSEHWSPKQSSGTWDILGYRILISGMIMVSNPLQPSNMI
jgi:hypothetical protein